ncbi:MAG: hypothetical protein LBP41_02385 [Holosporaceae bacterium]|jgi:hypothetical protein|nr:hypothetical protein [Holosporaceae bacterium]
MKKTMFAVLIGILFISRTSCMEHPLWTQEGNQYVEKKERLIITLLKGDKQVAVIDSINYSNIDDIVETLKGHNQPGNNIIVYLEYGYKPDDGFWETLSVSEVILTKESSLESGAKLEDIIAGKELSLEGGAKLEDIIAALEKSDKKGNIEIRLDIWENPDFASVSNGI